MVVSLIIHRRIHYLYAVTGGGGLGVFVFAQATHWKRRLSRWKKRDQNNLMEKTMTLLHLWNIIQFVSHLCLLFFSLSLSLSFRTFSATICCDAAFSQ